MNSHHNLDQIFHLLWNEGALPRGDFAELVFRMVLFHHSLKGVIEKPVMVALNGLERYKFCDPEFFRLMKVFMIADGEVYTFFDEKERLEQREEYIYSSKEMVKDWNRRHKQSNGHKSVSPKEV